MDHPELLEFADPKERAHRQRVRVDIGNRLDVLREDRIHCREKVKEYEALMREEPELRPTREDYEMEKGLLRNQKLQKIKVGQVWERNNPRLGKVDKIIIKSIDTIEKCGGSGGNFMFMFEYLNESGPIPGSAPWLRENWTLVQEPQVEGQGQLFGDCEA
jgi:hypothetical protein